MGTMRTTKTRGSHTGRGTLQFPGGGTAPVSYTIRVSQHYIDGEGGAFDLQGSLVCEGRAPHADLLRAFQSQEILALEDTRLTRPLQITVSALPPIPPLPERCSFRVQDPTEIIAPYIAP